MFRFRGGFIAGLAVAAGCSTSPALIPVTGLVRLDDRPAEGVQVSFWPADEAGADSRDRYGAGRTGPDGRFELRAFSGPGVERGNYKVTFSRPVAGSRAPSKGKPEAARESLPERYTGRDTTEQTATVGKGQSEFVFELRSAPK